MAIPKFSDIVRVIAAVRCLNAGQTIEQVAASTKVSPKQIRGWLRAAGYRQIPTTGKWVVAY